MRTVSLGERAVVRIVGDLEIDNAPALRSEIDRPIDNDQRDLVVDLTAKTFIDSTGIGALMGTLKAVRGSDGRMELVLDDAKVLKIFRIAGLTSVFVIHPDLTSALQEPP